MRHGRRVAALAVLASLGLHALLLGGLRGLSSNAPPPPEVHIVDARLVTGPPPASRPAPAPPPGVRPKPSPPPQPAPPSEPASQSEPVEAVTADSPPPDSSTSFDDAATPTPLSTPQAEAVSTPPGPTTTNPDTVPAPPLNALPARIDMRFSLHYGLASGEQTLVWINEGQRYTLTSVAAATGLTGMFYRGRFVQTSRGRITPQGLQPEEFWDQRGDKRASARLDAAGGQVSLTTTRGDIRHFPYAAGMQDALSLFLQLALTAPPPDGALRFAVFNGKKVRDYVFAVRDEVELDTALGPLRALHLVRIDNPDERFEAWLAIDRHYLPVHVLRRDDKGNEITLRVRSISP